MKICKVCLKATPTQMAARNKRANLLIQKCNIMLCDYFGENIYPANVAESLVRFTRQKKNLVTLISRSECSILWLIILPLTNFESASGKSVLPAVLIILRVENSVSVFF